MRNDVMQVLLEYEDLRKYVRQHPKWYRRLGRDPSLLSEVEKEANYFYGRTLPQRVERVQNNLSLAMMMIEMLQMSQATVSQPMD